MRQILTFTFLVAFQATTLFASGAPSTYFNIYVPPNNDAVKRDVALIVTAIYDNTTFTITDDGADGDTDDTVNGTLNSGQSYVLYIRDNGINDDAQSASGGVLKRDGDYFIINSSNLVFASMSTDSDWQHDFVPSFNKTSLGEKFIIYAPKTTSSNRDLNVFAYEDNTTLTISKISTVPTTTTGYTNVDLGAKTIVKQRTINRGQDIIHLYNDGRDIMETGATYMIETNKAVSVQYGALWGNARDGGGYVPSSNGSSSGELFYFAVPYQSNGEQEIRIVSWDNSNTVTLERYDNGNWVGMNTWTLNRLKPADWIGKKNNNATYGTVFRIKCTAGKKVSVFESNWMETGSPGTSDMASMVSSEDGSTTGKDYLVYILPPGLETNVVNPFTGQFFGGKYSHCYLYAGNQTTTVTIKDAKTNGTIINRTYTIAPNRYVDAFFNEVEWKSIYNGTGNPDTGPDRPYVLIESSHDIAVMNTNTNDNWMMYFGSSLASGFTQSGSTSQNTAIPGDQIEFKSTLTNGSSPLETPSLTVTIGSGAIPTSSTLSTNNQTIEGTITIEDQKSTIIYENIPNLAPYQQMTVNTEMEMSSSFNNGAACPNNTVISVESAVAGYVNGRREQSVITEGIQNVSSNTSKLIYNPCASGPIIETPTDSWNAAWVDYNNDGWEDLFVCDRDPSKNNLLYKNNGNGSFTNITSGPLVNTAEKTIASAWGDYNNDGWIDVFVINATGSRSRLYKNTNGTFVEIENSGIDSDPQYFHGGAWVDMDNDGYLDLIVTNYFETKFHHVYRNNKNGTFTKLLNNPIAQESNRSTMPALADYDNDGLVDVFIPNGDNRPNSLFKNLGNGQYAKVDAGPVTSDAFNSVGASWGDYDNDGWMDLIVLNASKQYNNLYHNLGNGAFESITNTSITEDAADTHSALWTDHDNDGDLDLFVSNDQGVKFYFTNEGSGTFTKKLSELITANFGKAMGIAAADYNKDGSQDIFITTHSDQKNKLFCNQSTDPNHFLNIKLVGRNSNKSAIGASLKVVAEGGLTIYKQILPIIGIGSQNSLRQHIGLGQSKKISLIEIKWPSGFIQEVKNVQVDQYITITEDQSNLVTGFAFDDANGNCVWDNNESKIEGVNFTISSGPTKFATLKEGIYNQRLNDGNYTITLDANDYWTTTCQYSVSANGNNKTYNVNLPLTKIQNGFDLAITSGVTAWRRGFSNETIVSCNNLGTADATDPIITISYPYGVVLTHASIPWTSNDGNTYTWQLSKIKAGENISLKLRDSVTLIPSTGDVLPLSVNVDAQGVDLSLYNNTYTENIEVVGAIDPNDISVTPKGQGKEGYIKKDQQLKYLIRFQNVGTYHASRVVLENQLSSYFDLTTFKIESASHPGYNYNLSNSGNLTIVFNNIELPDSTTNEPASHGFFIYTISPKQDIDSGSKIDNSVLISFDYEDGVKSNIVTNTIKYSNKQESYGLTVFPNPTSQLINIIAAPLHDNDEIPLLNVIRIVNMKGQVIKEIYNKEEIKVVIDMTEFSNGVYHVLGFDAAGITYETKILKI